MYVIKCFVLPSGLNTAMGFSEKVGVWVLQSLVVQHSISHCVIVQNSRALRAPARAKHAAFLSETKNSNKIEHTMIKC